jgi:chemotaxis-related protein WspD
MEPEKTAAEQAIAAGEPEDCWNKVGVNGDSSCPELDRYFHCRNCPRYSAAAMHLLDRRLPAEYRRQWTEHYAREKKPAVRGKQSLVLFRIGPVWLALPTRVFREVSERRAIHSLPHRHQGMVLGLANVRGSLLICVGLGRLLGLEREPLHRSHRLLYDRLVVVEWQGKPLAFPVDEVYGIHRYDPVELKEAPGGAVTAGSSFTRHLLNWESRQVNCLDEELLFSTMSRSLA